VSDDEDESIPVDDSDASSELHFTGDLDPVCHKQFQPRSVAVDSDGNIAVYDVGNGVVKVFRLSDGGLLRTIGGRSSGYRPLSRFWELCGIAFDMEGNLVVTDHYHEDCRGKNNRLLVLRYSDGAVIRIIELPNVRPVGLAFDGAGHVVVVDYLNFVHVLRYSDGQFIRSVPFQPLPYWGGGGGGGSVAIDPCGRIVRVVDRRVLVVE
jgi:DNA-binding beta-propeller fold protein YncE